MVLSTGTRSIIAGEIRQILASSPGATPVHPNTPVLPLESVPATATFIDPTVQIIHGSQISVGQKDFLAPFASLSALSGYIKIGSSSSIGDNATLDANPTGAKSLSGIVIGDNVTIASGVTITGPSAVGAVGGAATTIGANAVIDGAIIQAGAYVGPLARVGPGVTINTGFRVLPGADVTTQAEATNPALGMVVATTAADATNATTLVTRNTALAVGYTNLYQGNSATGPGTTNGGPISSALNTTAFFGALNNVLGASSEPGAARVTFEPTSGTPTFVNAAGTNVSLKQNVAYNFPARLIGQVEFGQEASSINSNLGRRDSIRGDEGQAIIFGGPIGKLGNAVSIHSPLGGVRSMTTTTVVTSTTTSGVTTTTTNATTTTSMAAATATAGSTTATTSGRNASGVATTGTVTTTIANTTAVIGGITIGSNFSAGDNATILGGPSQVSTFGNNVSIGSGAVVDTSNLGSNVTIGARAYVANSTIPAGTVIPPGAIIINNVGVDQVQS